MHFHGDGADDEDALVLGLVFIIFFVFVFVSVLEAVQVLYEKVM